MTNQRLLSIDLLKGISIILVLLTHVNMTAQQKVSIFANLWIFAAVCIFMIVSAYNYSMRGAEDYYTPGVFLPRLLRILFPWIIIWLVEIIYLSLFTESPLSLHRLILLFLNGGNGPGGYYIPMLFQLLIVFQILYQLLEDEKTRLKMSCFLLLFCLCYELVADLLPLPAGFYRLCIFRLMSCLIAGILLFHYQSVLSKTMIPVVCFVVGMIYLYVISYTGYRPVIVRSWTPTSLFATPYSFAIVYWVLQAEKFLRGPIIKLLVHIGKCSYHILLVQKIYFILPLSKWLWGHTNLIVSICFDVIMCIIGGCIFFSVYSWTIGRWVNKFVSAHMPR